MRLSNLAIASAPMLFVLLWCTGFIGARFGLPYIEPMTFLAVRMVFVVFIMTAIALAAPPPADAASRTDRRRAGQPGRPAGLRAAGSPALFLPVSFDRPRLRPSYLSGAEPLKHALNSRAKRSETMFSLSQKGAIQC